MKDGFFALCLIKGQKKFLLVYFEGKIALKRTIISKKEDNRLFKVY